MLKGDDVQLAGMLYDVMFLGRCVDPENAMQYEMLLARATPEQAAWITRKDDPGGAERVIAALMDGVWKGRGEVCVMPIPPLRPMEELSFDKEAMVDHVGNLSRILDPEGKQGERLYFVPIGPDGKPEVDLGGGAH
jgi:hypothetical protein